MLLSGTGILDHMKFRLSLGARVVKPPLFEQYLGLMNAPYSLLLIYHTTDVPFMSTLHCIAAEDLFGILWQNLGRWRLAHQGAQSLVYQVQSASLTLWLYAR